jgi:hypothetical protein
MRHQHEHHAPRINSAIFHQHSSDRKDSAEAFAALGRSHVPVWHAAKAPQNISCPPHSILIDF